VPDFFLTPGLDPDAYIESSNAVQVSFQRANARFDRIEAIDKAVARELRLGVSPAVAMRRAVQQLVAKVKVRRRSR
jgi:hypothetical protein